MLVLPSLWPLSGPVPDCHAASPSLIPAQHEGDDGGHELSFNQFDISTPSRSIGDHPSGLGVVMDTGSTINTIKDSELLTNIKRVRPGVKVLTNGGEVIYDMMGTFQGVLKAWYNPDGMANILSFSALCNISKVSFVSAVKNMFLAEFSDGRLWQFVEANNGLFYYNPDVKHTTNASNNDVLNYCLVSTVADNESKYHHREVAAAKIAGKIHRSLGRPAEKIFESAVTTNQFKNCPVTVEDVKRYFANYGPDVASLQGKTVKRSSALARTNMPTPLPPMILQHHREVTLCIDNFCVQGIPFFHSISSKL